MPEAAATTIPGAVLEHTVAEAMTVAERASRLRQGDLAQPARPVARERECNTARIVCGSGFDGTGDEQTTTVRRSESDIIRRWWAGCIIVIVSRGGRRARITVMAAVATGATGDRGSHSRAITRTQSRLQYRR